MKKVLTILLTVVTILTYTTSVDATNTPFIVNNYTEINQLDTFTNVVIFIRFADETTYSAPQTLDYYEQLLNGVDQVSLRDYYLEVSYNQLDIVSYLVTDNSQIIYYTDSHTRDYYSPYDAITNTTGYANDTESREREHGLLKDALDYVEANNLVPDTLDIDKNNDGEIDSLTFMISGEDQGWSELLWPHKWELYTYYDFGAGDFEVDAPSINGKYAYYYTFELLGNSTDYYYSVNVGVLAHETFHLLSAPDLYHYYRYDWIEPTGDWGLMDNTGRTPSHMLGYMKDVYGTWMGDIPEITTSGDYTLLPLQDGNTNIYKINMGYSNEYIYLEYRDNEGLYESNLPTSGLLVYRVDLDYEGNEEGYYNESGTPQDEVFVFRPGIIDNSFPIVFSHEDISFVDEDGNIDEAALSQSNTINEIGKGTSDPMFYSDGTEINLKIFNVQEKSGYITFSVLYEESIPPLIPRIELITNETIHEDTTLFLVDVPNTEYYAEIIDLGQTYTAYYTVDGTTPSPTSNEYTDTIEVTSELNHVKVSIYDDTTLITTIEKVFDFTESIETAHTNYLNNQHITWYLQLQSVEDFHIFSNNLFEVEEDFDEVKITVEETTLSYTGTSLQHAILDYTSNTLLVEFITNEANDEFYGFDFDIIVGDMTSIVLAGENSINHTINTVFDDDGIKIINGREGYYVEKTDTVDPTSFGSYTVTYELYNPENELLQVVTRTVTVLDDQAPELELQGEETVTIELGSSYTDEGILYYDNYDTDPEFFFNHDVDTLEIGSYSVTYYAVDEAGNVSNTIIRTVNVVDTTPPVVLLQPGVDTIYVNETHTDAGIVYSDLDTVTVDIETQVDITKTGSYIITYIAKDSSENKTTINRYVTVTEKVQNIIPICIQTVTTYLVNEEYEVPTCTINNYDINPITTHINNSVPGTYEIVYKYQLNSITYTKVIYLTFVSDIQKPVAYIEPKRRDLV